jgi:hypothetical protein
MAEAWARPSASSSPMIPSNSGGPFSRPKSRIAHCASESRQALSVNLRRKLSVGRLVRSYNRLFTGEQGPIAVRNAEFIIIGAGIVGLATVLEYARRFPGKRLLVAEKQN